jgi:hypothetical protein
MMMVCAGFQLLESQFGGLLCGCNFKFQQCGIYCYYSGSIRLLARLGISELCRARCPFSTNQPGPMGNTLSSGFVARTVLHFPVRRQQNPLSNGVR